MVERWRKNTDGHERSGGSTHAKRKLSKYGWAPWHGQGMRRKCGTEHRSVPEGASEGLAFGWLKDSGPKMTVP